MYCFFFFYNSAKPCHHQIVFAKFNLKIFHPPPYECEIWHYSTDLIRRSVHEFSWENRFSNIDLNQKVYLFNETINNILSNFIPHETIVCDDHDPPWINSKIKNLIAEKILLRSAISKITVIFIYFKDFRAFLIS